MNQAFYMGGKIIANLNARIVGTFCTVVASVVDDQFYFWY